MYAIDFTLSECIAEECSFNSEVFWTRDIKDVIKENIQSARTGVNTGAAFPISAVETISAKTDGH